MVGGGRCTRGKGGHRWSSGASWDVYTNLILLTCDCRDRMRTVPPGVQPRVTLHPNTCLFTPTWPRAGDFSLSRHSRVCVCMIRIVNEVNTHLTSLQLSLVHSHGSLCCYIMQNDWLQLLHHSSPPAWCIYFPLDVCWWPGGHQEQGNAQRNIKVHKLYPREDKLPAQNMHWIGLECGHVTSGQDINLFNRWNNSFGILFYFGFVFLALI